MTKRRSPQFGHRILLVGAGVGFWMLLGWYGVELPSGALLATAALLGVALWSLAALLDGPAEESEPDASSEPSSTLRAAARFPRRPPQR